MGLVCRRQRLSGRRLAVDRPRDARSRAGASGQPAGASHRGAVFPNRRDDGVGLLADREAGATRGAGVGGAITAKPSLNPL